MEKKLTLTFKALADPTRRRVLQLLRHGPMQAGQIAENVPIGGPTLSFHLSILQQAKMVDRQRQGRNMVYHLRLDGLELALIHFAKSVGLKR